MSDSPKPIRTLRTPATASISICKKCGKKLGGGFGPGGRQSLAKALRSNLNLGKGKRATVRIVETGCLKYCPKHAVVVLDGARPGEALIVPQGTEIPEIAARLRLLAAAVPETI